MGYGLRYQYGIFKQSIKDGWQQEQPDNWLRSPDPWEVARPNEKVEVELNCSFELSGGSLRALPGRPSTLIGIPYDRPVVGYGGSTINTLRLWAADAPEYFNFQEFSGGDFVEALAETLTADTLTRVLYPDDSTSAGQGLRLVQEYFLVACSLADVVRRFQRSNSDWSVFPDKAAIQLNDTHPAIAVPELMRILLDEAHLGWDEAWNITRSTLAYTNHTLLPEALEKWPLRWFEMMLPRQLSNTLTVPRRPPASAYSEEAHPIVEELERMEEVVPEYRSEVAPPTGSATEEHSSPSPVEAAYAEDENDFVAVEEEENHEDEVGAHQLGG